VAERRRYIVVGAGAIGGTIGGVLARAGADAVLVARGAHARALSDTGLRLRTPDGVLEIPVTVAASPDDVALTERDVLVFATKTQQLDAALQDWADRPVRGTDGTAGELLPVLTALNGVAAEEKALRYFARVLGVCVWMPAAHVTPGEVIIRSWPVAGQFHVARWPAALATAEDRELLADLADTWTTAGILIQLPPDVRPWKYNKLLSNLNNAVVALTGSRTGGEELVAALRSEAEAVLAHAGIEFVPFSVTQAQRAHGPKQRPVDGTEHIISNSTWQSLARTSGSVETDFLNGEIVLLGRLHGVPTPVNALLQRLAGEAARERRAPGSMRPEEVLALH